MRVQGKADVYGDGFLTDVRSCWLLRELREFTATAEPTPPLPAHWMRRLGLLPNQVDFVPRKPLLAKTVACGGMHTAALTKEVSPLVSRGRGVAGDPETVADPYLLHDRRSAIRFDWVRPGWTVL